MGVDNRVSMDISPPANLKKIAEICGIICGNQSRYAGLKLRKERDQVFILGNAQLLA